MTGGHPPCYMCEHCTTGGPEPTPRDGRAAAVGFLLGVGVSIALAAVTGAL